MLGFENIKFIKSANQVSQFPEDSGNEIAFVGRSNAGKSTVLNVIFNRKNIAKTSKTPGRTQLVNFFKLNDNSCIVDLPGYGFANVSRKRRNQWDRLISNYFKTRAVLTGVFLVVDGRRGITDLDRVFIDFYLPLEKSLHVLINKSDKLKKSEQALVLGQFESYLSEVATIQLFSGTKKMGLEIAQNRLIEMLKK